MKTMLKAKYVVAFENGDHAVYRDGEVVFEGDTILFAGRGYAGDVDTMRDLGDALIGPGFIDLDAIVDYDHGIFDVVRHADPARGYRGDGTRMRQEDWLSPRAHYIKHKMGQIQLMLNGITCGMPIAGDGMRGWAETYDEMADAARAAQETGMRMYLGPSYRLRPFGGGAIDPVRGRKSFEDALRYIEDFDGYASGLVRGYLSPCQIRNLDEGLLRESRAMSESLGVPIRLHACEDPAELTYLRETFDATPLEYLANIGFLGERTLIPHAIYAGDMLRDPHDPTSELALLRESGTSVIHAPIAEAHGGLALYHFSRYLAQGVNLTLATDTHPADMIQNMNFAWNLTRIFERGETFLPLGQILPHDGPMTTEGDLYRAATINAARALGREDLGRLCAGAKADIIAVDFSGYRTRPIEDPIRTLIMNTTGRDVQEVYIDGRHVVGGGLPTLEDAAALFDEAQTHFDTFKQGYSHFDRENRPTEQLFPCAFPLK